MENLFSYGSLRQSAVQIVIFGRAVELRDDAIVGYRLSPIRLTDARTIELTGTADHFILEKTGNPTDQVEGAVLRVTQDDLDLADAYEPPEYRRARADLRSGDSAWVYVRV